MSYIKLRQSSSIDGVDRSPGALSVVYGDEPLLTVGGIEVGVSKITRSASGGSPVLFSSLSAASGVNLGLVGHGFSYVYTNYIRNAVSSDYNQVSLSGSTLTLSSKGTSTLTIDGGSGAAVRPSTTKKFALGTSSYLWTTVYAQTGTINTSDRASKTNIKKVVSASSHAGDVEGRGPSIDGDEVSNDISSITIEEVVKFVKDFDPVTFIYKDEDRPDVTEETADPASVQLGMIADDIKSSPLFKYIGIDSTYQIPDPDKYELVDDPDNPHNGQYKVLSSETEEYVDEKDTDKITKEFMGLKPLAVATAALTACKYLINEVESLKSK